LAPPSLDSSTSRSLLYSPTPSSAGGHGTSRGGGAVPCSGYIRRQSLPPRQTLGAGGKMHSPPFATPAFRRAAAPPVLYRGRRKRNRPAPPPMLSPSELFDDPISGGPGPNVSVDAFEPCRFSRREPLTPTRCRLVRPVPLRPGQATQESLTSRFHRSARLLDTGARTSSPRGTAARLLVPVAADQAISDRPQPPGSTPFMAIPSHPSDTSTTPQDQRIPEALGRSPPPLPRRGMRREGSCDTDDGEFHSEFVCT